MIELYNSSDVKEVLFSTTLELLAGTDPTFQVQLRSLPGIFLHQTALFLWPYTGVIQSVPGWANIPCVQQYCVRSLDALPPRPPRQCPICWAPCPP